MLRSLDEEAWTRVGTANDAQVSVRALAFIMAGHVRHHMESCANVMRLGGNRLISRTTLVWPVLIVLAAGSVALAQGGGKAEPNRIEFKRGANSTTINGKVRGDEEAEYVLAARKGQKLTIKLSSVPSRFCFNFWVRATTR